MKLEVWRNLGALVVRRAAAPCLAVGTCRVQPLLHR
jgi:hypothetical protein